MVNRETGNFEYEKLTITLLYFSAGQLGDSLVINHFWYITHKIIQHTKLPTRYGFCKVA
jgi:hypothetical protein